MSKNSINQYLGELFDRALLLCGLACLFMGVSLTLLYGAQSSYFIQYQRTQLGSFSGKVTSSEPTANISFTNLGDVLIEIQGFASNETPVALLVYCFNDSLAGPLIFSINTTYEFVQEVEITGDVTIAVHRLNADALFACWLVRVNRMLVSGKPYLLQIMPYIYPLIVTCVFLLSIGIYHLWVGARRLRELD